MATADFECGLATYLVIPHPTDNRGNDDDLFFDKHDNVDIDVSSVKLRRRISVLNEISVNERPEIDSTSYVG